MGACLDYPGRSNTIQIVVGTRLGAQTTMFKRFEQVWRISKRWKCINKLRFWYVFVVHGANHIDKYVFESTLSKFQRLWALKAR